MHFKKIKSWMMSEDDLRELWRVNYCLEPIITFDRMVIRFYEDMFDHAFYESENHKEKDKSLLSLNRCEKMLWIKDTLQDPTALIKQGWLKDKKQHTNSRRVAMVKGNYIVIIQIINSEKARFITAYQIENLRKFLNSPDWT